MPSLSKLHNSRCSCQKLLTYFSHSTFKPPANPIISQHDSFSPPFPAPPDSKPPGPAHLLRGRCEPPTCSRSLLPYKPTYSLLPAGQLGSQSLTIQILSLRSCKPSDTYSLHLAQGDLALATSLTGFSTTLLNFSALDTLTLLILKNANHTSTWRPEQFYLKYFRGSSVTSLYILFLEPFSEYAN